jgi:hypothetical protein
VALLVRAEGIVELRAGCFDGLGVSLGVFRGWGVLLGRVGLPACGLGEG